MLKKVILRLQQTKIQARILTGIVGVVLVGIAGLYLFIQTNQSFSANFADDVLRPLIGNTATISIESDFFALQDSMNQIKYRFVKPNAQIFAEENVEKVQTTEATFDLSPLHVSSSLSGAGIWSPLATEGKDVLLAQTFLQPDLSHQYAITALVKMNMNLLNIDAVAGTWEPGEAAHKGPGRVPVNVQMSNNLIAAFNGGFQRKDGGYGMVVGSQIYLPLKEGLATLVIYSDKKPQMVDYQGQNFGRDVVAIRQNGPLLIDNGKIVTYSEGWNMQTWGLTTTNSMYTWRSGLGITKNGNLIYAVGPSLIPESLAMALQKAGAVEAMQLDINPVWVRFVLYNPLGNGKYAYTPLLKQMVNGGLSYLTGYQKDFFYLSKK